MRLATGGRTLWYRAVLPLALSLSAATILESQTTLRRFPLPPCGFTAPNVSSITRGPDGALWFAEQGCHRIGRITLSGALTEYPIDVPPGGHRGIRSITTGPDGALWFKGESVTGRITVDGRSTLYSHLGDGSIASGPDGALWFSAAYSIGRMTTDGRVTLSTYGAAYASDLAVGSDGALWFSASSGVGRVTTEGKMTTYPSGCYSLGDRAEITAGPDGALWFLMHCGDGTKIARMTTSGELKTTYPADSTYRAITTGPDGALWFLKCTAGAWLLRLAISGEMTKYAADERVCAATMTVGPDGNFWAGDLNSIWQIAITGSPDSTKPTSAVSPLPANVPAVNFMVQWGGKDTGTGIWYFDVFVSEDWGPYRLWWRSWQPAETQKVFFGTAGHTYGFYSIAADQSQNVEDPKTAAEAITRTPLTAVGDINADGRVTCADIAVLKASFGKRTGQPGFDPRADVNSDGIVDIRDLAWVSQKLPTGTVCP